MSYYYPGNITSWLGRTWMVRWTYVQVGKLEEAVFYGRSEFEKFYKLVEYEDLLKVVRKLNSWAEILSAISIIPSLYRILLLMVLTAVQSKATNKFASYTFDLLFKFCYVKLQNSPGSSFIASGCTQTVCSLFSKKLSTVKVALF